MKTLYNLSKSAGAALRDLLCFVLAWLLVGTSEALARLRKPWATSTAVTLSNWGRKVQSWAPSIDSPFPPSQENLDE